MNTIQQNEIWSDWLHKWFYWLLVPGILINVTGLYDIIIEPDGALYATIAKTMAQSGDFINLKVEGKDWLDKPHFPFWMAAVSFKIFGINSFAYKFPALLFWAAGACYTYLFAKGLHNKVVARLSVLIYLTAAHLVISNNDVRAEPYLTGLTIGSVYHFYRASQKSFSFHLVTGALLAACAVMTKGPFILITIGAGFITGWIIKKEWQQFLHYKWWIAFFLILLFITPELYSLYRQFDTHPEKLVFGQTNVSGIRFFFYDSQFGRFFNTGPIKGKGDLSFYLHTLLWAFLPWSLLLYTALVVCIRNMKNKMLPAVAYISIGASIATFIVFSLSRFQLPHYINILFPFFSIITAQYLSQITSEKTTVTWLRIQTGICSLLFVLMIVVTIFFRPPYMALILTIIITGALLAYLLNKKKEITAVANLSIITAIVLYGFVNLFFYPAILSYQSGSEAAFFINSLPVKRPVCTFRENSYSFGFYLDQPVNLYQNAEILRKQVQQETAFLFTRKSYLDSLEMQGFQIKVLSAFPHYHISKLTGKFINYRTRKNVVDTMVVSELTSIKNTQ
ncbi:MAG: glycosyltransferase family 39 protein [Chitinophagaceae bacterium]